MAGFPVSPSLPEVDADGMLEVDRLMVDRYGISLVRMMENAGRHLAEVTRRTVLDGDPRGRRVAVLAGSGGNGGGALVAARRLAGWGAEVLPALTRPDDALAGVTAEQWHILRRLPGVTPLDLVAPGPIDAVLDGVIGYSLAGAPSGRAAELIGWAGTVQAPVLALDVPSGYDAATGRMHVPAVRAAATVTLAMPKPGLQSHALAPWVGDLYCADLGVPPALYAEPSVAIADPPVFWAGDILSLPTRT